jgi:hypothetical protein
MWQPSYAPRFLQSVTYTVESERKEGDVKVTKKNTTMAEDKKILSREL